MSNICWEKKDAQETLLPGVKWYNKKIQMMKCMMGALKDKKEGTKTEVRLDRQMQIFDLISSNIEQRHRHGAGQHEERPDLSKIWRIMRNNSAMGSATHRSQALAYTRPSRSSRSAQPSPSGNQSRSCQNQSLSPDIILQYKTHKESAFILGSSLATCRDSF